MVLLFKNYITIILLYEAYSESKYCFAVKKNE